MADFKQNYFQRRTKDKGPRSNNRISSPEVQVIGSDGENIGIINTNEAISMAKEQGLDLIEIAPNAKPPVCKIIDMGKFKYDAQKKANVAKKKQKIVLLKEIKMRPVTETHDYDFKVKNAKKFIGILIENYAGKFPFWIAPLQAVVIPISEEFDSYAKEVNEKINNTGISSEVDLKNHNLNYKIREHSLSKIPLLLICGKKEVDSNSVTIRRLDTNKQENMELNLFLKKFSALNKAPSN